MAATSFRVENQKALRLAECLSIPRLMIICGSNGTGKSTLLWALMRRDGLILDNPSTQVLYQSPHRVMRTTNVQRRWVNGARNSYTDGLEGQNVATPEGMSIPNASRAPDNVDESGSTIKYSLAKLENRRHTYLAAIFDRARQASERVIDVSKEKDVYEPFSALISRLLPHLTFKGIDFSNEDNIQVSFIRASEGDGEVTIDLNDLSSGEKAVILLFLPLVEAEIIRELDRLAPENADNSLLVRDKLFLLDEPELHLHPDLQRRMLTYMRERSSRDNVQFILVTHSPTILDEASDEELYVLTPAFQDKNQLRQAASPSERLEALRDLTGDTFFLSTGRNIVCCEGESGIVKGKASDRSLMELFTSRSSRYTFISMGGRSQVIEGVKKLRNSLPVENYGVAIVGLVDADRASTDPDGCISWPFCEIENALLNSTIISEVVNAYLSNEDLTKESVDALFSEAGLRIRDDEIRMRVAQKLGTLRFRPKGLNPEEVMESYSDFVSSNGATFTEENIRIICSTVTAEVDGQLEDGSFLRRFRGKSLLRFVFGSLKVSNLSFERFSYLIAGRLRDDASIATELESVFNGLDGLVHDQLAQLLAPLVEVADTIDTAL